MFRESRQRGSNFSLICVTIRGHFRRCRSRNAADHQLPKCQLEDVLQIAHTESAFYIPRIREVRYNPNVTIVPIKFTEKCGARPI